MGGERCWTGRTFTIWKEITVHEEEFLDQNQSLLVSCAESQGRNEELKELRELGNQVSESRLHVEIFWRSLLGALSSEGSTAIRSVDSSPADSEALFDQWADASSELNRRRGHLQSRFGIVRELLWPTSPRTQ